MKKALMLSTVVYLIDKFNWDNIHILQGMGYEVHVATNFDPSRSENVTNEYVRGCYKRLVDKGIIIHEIDFVRSPFSWHNLNSIWQLVKLYKKEKYSLIHVHSPMGGFLGRLAAVITNSRNIIYTAHGFHFYKGMPKINLLYKWMEHIAAHWTDALITINKEDFTATKAMSLRQNGSAYYVPGVGIDTQKYDGTVVDTKEKRKELGIPEDAFIFISVGELSKRKNHIQAIEALAVLKQKYPQHKINLIICGNGSLKEKLIIETQKKRVSESVMFLGFRTDLIQILRISDAFIFPSLQEGLPVALMESMATGLPVIATKIRGNVDLIREGVNGFLVNVNDIGETVNAMEYFLLRKDERLSMGEQSRKIVNEFDISKIRKEMEKIYSSFV